MATRFYFPAPGSGTPPVSPLFSPSWEQNAGAVRLNLQRKTRLSALTTLADTSPITVPVTTTQTILCAQFISEPIPAQTITGTFGIVVSAKEDAATTNVALAYQLFLVRQDGGGAPTSLGGIEGVDTEFAITAATRIQGTVALTTRTSKPGDRIVLEIGAQATAPSPAGTFTMRFGTSAATDFALTTALTTDLNPWIEFSQDIWHPDTNNFRFFDTGSGMSTSGKIY